MSEPVQIVFGIDPGPVESAWCIWDGTCIRDSGMSDNESLADRIAAMPSQSPIIVACEQTRCYGMAVGREVFDTVRWEGRFDEACGRKMLFVPRLQVKMHLCHNARAKDANVRQAIIDRFGESISAAKGTKKAPGPLRGISGHVWSALAVALTAAENAQ